VRRCRAAKPQTQNSQKAQPPLKSLRGPSKRVMAVWLGEPGEARGLVVFGFATQLGSMLGGELLGDEGVVHHDSYDLSGVVGVGGDWVRTVTSTRHTPWCPQLHR
jgi:hypothetical protein